MDIYRYVNNKRIIRTYKDDFYYFDVNRGVLKTGNYADIAVIDIDNFRDKATYENPHQYAEGIVHLFVNGTQSIKDGTATGKRNGQPIRRG